MSEDGKVSWREMLAERMRANGESFDDVVFCSLSSEEMDRRFRDYGGAEGKPFTLWTKLRVYFPTDYDGTESVRSVPRDPCDEITRHVGGGGCSSDEGVKR